MEDLDFNELIDNYLKRELKIRIIGKYYPSEVGSCLRKNWYSFRIPKETDKETLKVFEAGKMIHQFIADSIKSEKNPEVELIETETPFVLDIDNFTVSGRVDDIILVKIKNKKFLIEVKSTSSLKFINEPNESHILQLNLYLNAFKIDNGIILYIEKNTLKCKWFFINQDKDVFNLAISRFKELHNSLTKSKIPEPEARIKKELWQCKNCIYREECYKETPESIID